MSKEIHNSLGILSGLDELEVISEKLDSKIAAIELEKKELVEPLKNAAKFTEIVKAENVEISVLQFNSIDALIKATSGWETKNADIKLMNECVYFVLYLRKTDNTNILDDDYLKMFDVKCSLTNK